MPCRPRPPEGASPLVPEQACAAPFLHREAERDGEQRARQPNAPRRPGCRVEVEQLLAAEQRGLIAHVGNLDRRMRVELVAVLVAPFPEVGEPGDRTGEKERGPGVEAAATTPE